MLAILELPDKTAHKGLSCDSSNNVGVQTKSTTTPRAPTEPPPSPDSRSTAGALPRHMVLLRTRTRR